MRHLLEPDLSRRLWTFGACIPNTTREFVDSSGHLSTFVGQRAKCVSRLRVVWQIHRGRHRLGDRIQFTLDRIKMLEKLSNKAP